MADTHMRPVAASIAAMLLLSAATTSLAQPATTDPIALAQFASAVQDYVVMHRQVDRTLPPLAVTADVRVITGAIERLAGTIRVQRRDARMGDLLTSELAPILRDRIAASLAEHGLTAADLLADEAAQGIDGSFIPLNVNDSFPWRWATAMLPCLLEVLPELPAELQYRIVGHTLVLVDVHASLIVDLLPDALAATELR